MKVGQHLFTKDGRNIGNAIITEATDSGLYRMETDFGNGGSLLNEDEITRWWYTEHRDGEVKISDVARWREDKRRLHEERELANVMCEPSRKKA